MENDEPKNRGPAQDVPRLRLFASPSDIGKKEDSRRIKFELFFDLWFVANIQILAEDKEITEPRDLRAYIGFLCILWFTWFSVCLFDVRFMTDSIFERVIRIVQFGSMVGFTVVVSRFDPEKPFNDLEELKDDGSPHRNIFQILSLILMVVRLSLVAQYCSDFWLKYRGRNHHGSLIKPEPNEKPILAAAAIHFVSAMVYLGISFRFSDEKSSRVHIVWYVGSAMEAVLQLALACRYEVLDFGGTQLTERMAVFTIVVLGEGVSQITKNILLAVDNGANWTSSTTGVFVSAVATTYFLYLLYFDWMNHQHLHGYPQLIYSLFHFPFHAALLLFGAGSALFIKWWQAVSNPYPCFSNLEADAQAQIIIIYGYDAKMESKAKEVIGWSESDFKSRNFTTKSEAMAQGLWDIAQEVDKKYPIKDSMTREAINIAVKDMKLIPDGFWDPTDLTDAEFSNVYSVWYNSSETYSLSIYNTVLAAFEINPYKNGDNESDSLAAKPTPDVEGLWERQWDVFGKVAIRAETTFQYVFASAGIALLLMTFFHVLTLTKRRWAAFDYIRVGLFVAASLGLGLVPLLSTDAHEPRAIEYYSSPWILPTTCLTVFGVFVLTHVHPPPLRLPRWARWTRKNQGRASAAGYRSLQNQPREDGHNVVDNGREDVRSSGHYISLQSVGSGR